MKTTSEKKKCIERQEKPVNIMKIIKKVHREIRKVGKYYENKKIKAK